MLQRLGAEWATVVSQSSCTVHETMPAPSDCLLLNIISAM